MEDKLNSELKWGVSHIWLQQKRDTFQHPFLIFYSKLRFFINLDNVCYN